MAHLRWMTAGESHGQGVLGIIEGIPAGFVPDQALINAELKRRQGGYGRGKRMEIESDHALPLSGLKRGVTLGSPVVLMIPNKDHRIEKYRKITRPRPGHADLPGTLKYGSGDCADIMERASARETAGRVAVGALAAQLLLEFGIEVFSYVTRIGTVDLSPDDGPEGRESVATLKAQRNHSPLYSLNPAEDPGAVALIDELREAGDSVGGQFVVEVLGAPAGLGSMMQWQDRLDGRLAGALMAIQAMKAVEIGAGVAAATLSGQAFHDAIAPGEPQGVRSTNRAGGLEGGMTNGEPIVCRVTMKPIPSVTKPLGSIDLETGEAALAVYERSDVCSVPAASVVGESVVALVLLEALLEKTGGDSMDEVRRNLDAYRKSWGQGGAAQD